MNKQSVLGNNKGASLVMIIVAMLFVGLIASIVLTLTVSNSKSAKATIDTSTNFYTSESVLDDLTMFFKKIATSAASEAYAQTLEETTNPSLIESLYRTKFLQKLSTVLKSDVLDVYGSGSGTDINGRHTLDSGFVKDQITFSRSGEITVKYDSFVNDTNSDGVIDISDYPAVLKGVQISYIDERGYENTITVDLTFKANLPETNLMDSSENFTYGIDHFVVISGKSLNPKNKLMAGEIEGSIYALENININTKTPVKNGADCSESDWVTIGSEYVLAGKNINVNGRLKLTPIDIGTFTHASQVWCDNIRLSYTDSEVITGSLSGGPTNSLNTDVYLAGNLELNGQESKYTGKQGNLYGYSYSNATYYKPTYEKVGEKYVVTSAKPKSSAILVNGFSSKLDLSGLTSVNLAGNSYSALPSPNTIDHTTGTGNKSVYDFYSGASAEADEVYYYSQGDSITLRSLQALYLIPGDYIKGVGHNPMKASEFAGITIANLDIPTTLLGKLNSGKFKSHTVQYMNGENYVYLFWDFSSIDSAIEYFNEVTASEGRYEGLFEKQVGVLGNAGEIKLPSSGVNTKGYAITYNKDASPKFNKVNPHTPDVSDCEGHYNGLMTTLRENAPSGTDLISNMFKNKFDDTHIAYQKFSEEMYGPYQGYEYAVSSGSGSGTITMTLTYSQSDSRKYTLITGPNVMLGDSDGVGCHDSHPNSSWEKVSPTLGMTYVIITPGDVELNYSGDFRGLIIAGGDVYVSSNLNMECLGDIGARTEKRYKKNTGELVKETALPAMTEFQALLAVAPNESDTDNANTRLRRIFNVANTELNAGSDDGSKFVVVEAVEWDRN